MPKRIHGFVKDSLVYFGLSVILGLIAIVSIPIYTRLFTPSEYGYFSLVLASIALLVVMVTGPIAAYVARFVPELESDTRGRKKLYTTCFFLVLFFSLVFTALECAVLFALKARLTKDLFKLFLVSLPILALTSGLTVHLLILRARRKSALFSIISILERGGSLALGLLLILVFSFKVSGVLIAAVLVLFILNAAALFYFRNEIDFRLKTPDEDVSRGVYTFGLPVASILLSQWVVEFSNRYLLGYFRSSSDVGIYSLAYGICDRSLMVIILPFIMSLTPIIVSQWDKDQEGSVVSLRRSSGIFFAITAAALSGVIALRKPLLYLLASPGYYSGAQSMVFISIGVFFFGLYKLATIPLLLHKRTALIAVCSISVAVVNIGLNLILIPLYGGVGAALATMIAYLAAFVIIDINASRYVSWKPRGRLIVKIVGASAVMGGVLFLFSTYIFPVSVLYLALEILIGGALIFGLFFLLKVFKISDLRSFIDYLLLGNR